MSDPLPPRIRAMIINYDSTQLDTLTIMEFCKAQTISRTIFYRIRSRAATESAALLHPSSSAPRRPARRYEPEVTNDLSVSANSLLISAGWYFYSDDLV